MGILSVCENLYFLATLRLPNSMKWLEKRRQVDKVINELGLTSCADTKVTRREREEERLREVREEREGGGRRERKGREERKREGRKREEREREKVHVRVVFYEFTLFFFLIQLAFNLFLSSFSLRLVQNSVRGVSDRERKRTNSVMELIIELQVLFLDEPTTGLHGLIYSYRCGPAIKVSLSITCYYGHYIKCSCMYMHFITAFIKCTL